VDASGTARIIFKFDIICIRLQFLKYYKSSILLFFSLLYVLQSQVLLHCGLDQRTRRFCEYKTNKKISVHKNDQPLLGEVIVFIEG
jgi:hypothetical protein